MFVLPQHVSYGVLVINGCRQWSVYSLRLLKINVYSSLNLASRFITSCKSNAGGGESATVALNAVTLAEHHFVAGKMLYMILLRLIGSRLIFAIDGRYS